VNQPSLPFTIRLANGAGGAVDPNFIPAGTFTVTPQLWDINTNTQPTPRVPVQVSSAVFNPSTLTISAANPSASFRLVTFPNNNPFTDPTALSTSCAVPGCAKYIVYFPDPNGLGAAQGASAGTPNPVWELLYFPIDIKAVEVSIPNFPPTNRVLYVSPSVSAGPTNAISTSSYRYQMRLRRNPQDIAAGGVVITTAVYPRQFTGTPITISPNNGVFTFTGTTTVLEFQIFTQNVQTFAGTSFDIEFAVTTPSAQFSTSVDISGLGTACAVGLGCLLCNPNPASGFTTCNPQRNVIATGFTIQENPIETKISFPNARVAPYVGEPFFFDFSWMPPLATGMTITVSGLYTGETPNAVPVNTVVPAGATSARAGPFTPLPPPNVEPTLESFDLTYSFALLVSGDSSWFGFNINGVRNANVMTVTVFRRYLVASSLSRAAAINTLNVNLASTGVPTPPLCVSLNIPMTTYTGGPANPSLTATPISFVSSTTANNANRWNGLVFNPSVLTFTPTVQTQCFTVAYDVKFKLTPSALGNSAAGTQWVFDVAWQLGGNVKEQYVNPWYCTAPITAPAAVTAYTCSPTGARIVNFPQGFVLIPNPITMWFLDGATNAANSFGQGLGAVGSANALGVVTHATGGNWFVGESRTFVVTTDWPTPNGLTYNLYAPGLTFAAITTSCASLTASCSFAAGAAGSQTQQTHYWNVTASVSGANAIVPGWSNPNVQAQDSDYFRTGVGMEVSGPDSALYQIPAPLPVSVRVRRVYVDNWGPNGITVAIGGSATFSVRVGEPVLRGLTFTPVVSNGNSGALTFTPSSITFTPGQTSVQTIRVTGNLLSGIATQGSPASAVGWNVRFVLSGADQQIFWITTQTDARSIAALDNKVVVYHRASPVITPLDSLPPNTPAGPLYAGVLYGPFRATIAPALATGEQLNIDWSTDDWAFFQNGVQVSRMAFAVGDTHQIFSARPLNVGNTRIFFTLTGTDSWKYGGLAQYNQVGILADNSGFPNSAADGAIGISFNAPLGRHTYTVLGRPVTVSFQSESIDNANAATTVLPQVVLGTRHYGQVVVNYPTAGLIITPVLRTSTAQVVFEPASWNLDNVNNGTVYPFSYTVVSINNFISGPANGATAGLALPLTQNNAIPGVAPPTDAIDISFSLTGAEATVHAAVATASLYVRRRNFLWDVQGGTAATGKTYNRDPITNFNSQSWNNHFVVGRRSRLFTIVVTSPPTNTVTLRLSHPAIQFTPALLSWGPNDVSKSFTFVPISIPPAGDNSGFFEVIVGGPDAQYYDYNNLWDALKNIQILPNLAFSPIPVTYIDQDVTGASVQLVDGLATGAFPYPADRAFSLHMFTPAAQGIQFEPSALSFSSSSSLSQSYVIRQMYPNIVDSVINTALGGDAAAYASGVSGTDSYPIGWGIKFIGTNKFIPITASIVPQEAQRVMVVRYQIIPSFPKTIANVWQPASFNLTRAPLAHLTLVPHQPDRDGPNGQALKYTAGGAAVTSAGARYGSAFATGKIVTDPPAVVFNPGQTISNFQVMAIGHQVASSYYRLDWQLSGHRDDRVCYVESGDQSPALDGPYTFSTYHVASSSVLSVATLAVCVCLMFVV
jgi:hypothetical protein